MTLATIGLLVVAMTMAPQSTGMTKDPLAAHRWTHRLLVVHLPDTERGRTALERLGTALETHMADVVDRDLLIVPVGERRHAATALRPAVELDAADRRAVRQRLGFKAADARLVLIGKDGGVKDTQAGDFDLQRVFALIDGMPMRRTEVRPR